ncbi:hypothetical protein ACFSR7_07735 [Cohnella sp. GCM10020058]
MREGELRNEPILWEIHDGFNFSIYTDRVGSFATRAGRANVNTRLSGWGI